jgi:hypothetical protein
MVDIEKLKADIKAAVGKKWGAQPMWHARLHRWEAFDRITMDVVPRYKTSGLSGDEWRTGVVTKFWFKGEVVHEDFRTSLEAAIRYLPFVYDEQTCPINERVIALDEERCDQPGCAEVWVARYLLKRRTASDGSYLADDESATPRFRKFCRKHLRRGDCSREDSDDNLIPLDALGPEDAGLTIESPAAFGGVVRLDEE